jgi:hypothetical protein
MRKLQVLYMDVARSLSGRLFQRCNMCTKEFTICTRQRDVAASETLCRCGLVLCTTHHRRRIGHLQNDLEWPDASPLRSPWPPLPLPPPP